MKDQKKLFDVVSLECSKKTAKLYSTSFSLAIRLLSNDHRDAIYSIYGFVRLADEIVDSFHNFDKSTLLKELKDSTIDAIEKNISINPIINSFQNVVKKYNIEWELIDAFLFSMEYDLTNKSCDDNSYKKYIKGSAEAVGLMCLHVFLHNKDIDYNQLKPYAESLGSAFQKINFLRDMHEDHNALGRVYFPSIKIDNFGNKEKKIIEEDILKDFENGLKGIKLLDKDSRKGVYLAYRYYTSLFKKIKNKDATQILNGRIRLSNFRKLIILITSQIEFTFKIR